METVAIVGGGLVDIYEKRNDPRTHEYVQGKSINMALSERGRCALRKLGLEEYILENYSIKMNARLIHDINGKRRAIPYGREDQFLLSVDRRFLNEVLLKEVEKNENISLNFNHRLVAANLKLGKMTFVDEKEKQKHQKADFIIGCDGAFSSVRQEMNKMIRFNYSQQYIDHGYIELIIPPNDNGEYAMEINFLHIWPRGSFMMIALPNYDHSFTVTLFMPFTFYESIHNHRDVIKFFEHYFPDFIPLIGEIHLIETFLSVEPIPLISIKCDPYHYSDKVLLMGDAAHAMVPFYGQGLNCGFEDCMILEELLENNSNKIEKVIPLFSEIRVEDCHTIIDLAMYNYIEMRDSVNSRSYLIRKKFDSILNKLLPDKWIPLYSMVTFTRIPYKKCLKDKEWQDNFISHSVKFIILAIMVGFIYNK